MAKHLVRIALGGALALAGCATNQEVAAKRCGDIANPAAHDQCMARELANLAKAQEVQSRSGDSSGGGGGY